MEAGPQNIASCSPTSARRVPRAGALLSATLIAIVVCLSFAPRADAQACTGQPSQTFCDPQDTPDTEPFTFDPSLTPLADDPIINDESPVPGDDPELVVTDDDEPVELDPQTDPTDPVPGALAARAANDVRTTANDPVAGSPIALQSRMVGASFVNGSTVGPTPRIGGTRGLGTLSDNHLGIGFSVGRYKGPGFSARFSSTPLSYVIPLEDPRWAVKIDLPITFSVINGNENLSASLGFGLRVPVYDHWTLTPEVRVGYTTNRTLDISAKLVNLSIISNYEVPLKNGYGVTFGNSVTWSRTVGSVYDLTNVILKNGAEVHRSAEMRLFDLPTRWEFALVHNKVLGDPVYINEWTDLSVSLGTIGSKNNVTWDSFRMGITYTRASRGIEGININFGYEF